jgi:hypothetical protein
MSRTLRFVGLAALAGAAWVLLASEAGWISTTVADAAFRPLALVGAISFGTGLLLGLLNPMSRKLRRSRCARCGAPIEKGQSYCLDHLRDTVHEYQDQMRRGERSRSRTGA